MKRGRRGTGPGEALPLLPDSASTIWMRHYIWSGDGDFGCPICYVAEEAKDSRFCAKGQRLREDALAEFKAIPPPPKKRPADTSFNPSIEHREIEPPKKLLDQRPPGDRRNKARLSRLANQVRGQR